MRKERISEGNSVYFFPDRENNPYHVVLAFVDKVTGFCECCAQFTYLITDALGLTHRVTGEQIQSINDSLEFAELTADKAG